MNPLHKLKSIPAILAITASTLCATPALAGGEVYLASAFPNSLNYGPVSNNQQYTHGGIVIGAGYYWGGAPFEYGIDLMHTDQRYKPPMQADLTSLSIMANGRYVVPISNNFDFYSGVGIGAVNVTYTHDTSTFLNGSQVIGGWQSELGVRYRFGNFDAFAGLKYQAGFDQAYIKNEYVEYNSLSLVYGLKF